MSSLPEQPIDPAGAPLEWSPDLLVDFDVLTSGECRDVRAGLEELREHWVWRHPVAPFYTLGANNYYDLFGSADRPYYDRARALNPVLLERFPDMYRKVADCLSNAFGVPVAYGPRLAVPGFNILLGHEHFSNIDQRTLYAWVTDRMAPENFSTPIHTDTPQLIVDWSDRRWVDLSRPISFTLSIALPEEGSGMYVWDLREDETRGMGEVPLKRLLEERARHLHRYAVGRMVVHSGVHYHAISSWRATGPEDARITLQGHAVMADGVGQLYW